MEGVGQQGELRVRVRALPVDGAANQALVELLATELRLPRSAISITGGERARRKEIAFEGVDDTRLRSRWPGLVTDPTD